MGRGRASTVWENCRRTSIVLAMSKGNPRQPALPVTKSTRQQQAFIQGQSQDDPTTLGSCVDDINNLTKSTPQPVQRPSLSDFTTLPGVVESDDSVGSPLADIGEDDLSDDPDEYRRRRLIARLHLYETHYSSGKEGHPRLGY